MQTDADTPATDPATDPDVEPEVEPSQDLGAAIIAEIERTLATKFATRASPLLLDLVDALAQTRAALHHRTGALQRIHSTLQAAASRRDDGVTAA